jgi:cyclophilin family peptidyl-prolyl cis-trans isomerase
MFGGRKKNRKNTSGGESSSRENNRYREDDIVEEIDMNDVKLDKIRSRMSTPEVKQSNTSQIFVEDIDRPHTPRSTGSIGDVIDDTPKLKRGLKARHVNNILALKLTAGN